MHRTPIAADPAKSVFQVAVADGEWRVLSRRRLTRAQLVRCFGERQPCRVAMEACGTAHHWGRGLQSRGFAVTLLPPQYVRAYVRRSKTDRSDADALLEAARCWELPTVPVKTKSSKAASHGCWKGSRTSRRRAYPRQAVQLLAQRAQGLGEGPGVLVGRQLALIVDHDAA